MRVKVAFKRSREFLSGWGDEIRGFWNLARNLIFAIGLLLFFLVAVEVVKFYQFLKTLDPTIAIVIAVGVSVLLLWFPVKCVLSLLRTPSSIQPPSTRLSADLGRADIQEHRDFLALLLGRLSKNPVLSDEERVTALNGLAETRRLKNASPPELLAGLLRVRTQNVMPLMEVLDGRAREEVRKAALHISGGVMLSPYQSIDSVIALVRTTGMAIKIIRMYYTRPTIRETAMILVDVVRVAAFVNVLNVGGMALRSLSGTPVVGWVASAATQGFGAGLFVLVVGNTAGKRCRALEKWDVEEAKLAMSEKIGVYGEQARSMVKTGMENLREKVPEAFQKGWEATQKTVSASLEAVTQSASTTVAVARESAPKIGKAGVQAAKVVADSAVKTGKATADLFESTGEKVVNTVKNQKWYRKKKFVPPDRSKLD